MNEITRVRLPSEHKELMLKDGKKALRVLLCSCCLPKVLNEMMIDDSFAKYMFNLAQSASKNPEKFLPLEEKENLICYEPNNGNCKNEQSN
jgi:hypothetical protein